MYISRFMHFNTARFQNIFFVLLLIGIIVNMSGLFMIILEPDAAYYAGIAKSMALSNDFVNLKDMGTDWLDKPHFPFWLTALSYKLFGYSSFAYRVPAFLFWLCGLYYTWKFAKVLYTDIVAKVAVLIYISAFHLIVSNSDVRAEPFLTGMVIAAVYHFYKASETKAALSVHLIAGALFAAMALMTKGLFVLVPVVAGLVFHWVLKKEWQKLFQWRWLIALFLLFLFTLPELYCLYVQFDMHPEKAVFGTTKVSGIRFFLWDSQFGRFFNTGPYKGQGEVLFYAHTVLWAFLPWSLLLYAAHYTVIRKLFKKKENVKEFICFGAGLFTFLMFSLSSFQLPHYLNIVFPFYAVITAQWLVSLQRKRSIKVVNVIQIVMCCLILLLICLVLYLFGIKAWWIASAFVLLAAMLVFLFKKRMQPTALIISFFSSCILFLILNLLFYPALLQYQSGTKAANYMNSQMPNDSAGVFETRSYSFEFYMKKPVRYVSFEDLQRKAPTENVVLFITQENIDKILQKGYKVEVLNKFTHFHISQLNFKFINAATRDKETKQYILAKVQ
jgi:4-amino-4-deoxy-L-arabinose transferase-like glycosyltransferase